MNPSRKLSTETGQVHMEGKIRIELVTSHTPDSGSGLPDLGHDAYWLMKELSKLAYKDPNGKEQPLAAKYKITRVETEVGGSSSG